MNRTTRRRYLAGLVGVAALSGCQDALDPTGGSDGSDPDDEDDEDDSDGEDSSNGPAAAVETFYAALDAGRFDVANEYLHNETTQQPITEQQYGDLAEGSVSAGSTEVIEQSEDRAVVRTSVNATYSDSGRQLSNRLEIELRTQNGEWRVYSVRPADSPGNAATEEPTPDDEPTPDSGPGPGATGDPRAVVREFYVALDDGNRRAANALIHSEARGVEVTERAADAMERATVTADGVRVLERSSRTVSVEATVTFSPEGSDREQTSEVRIELRPEDGRWKIFASGQAN